MYRHINEDEVKVDKTLGYQYFIDKNHPLASPNIGRVYYHRHVASIKEGRWLSTLEVVHHIDGNKLNNELSNLQVMTSKSHAELHQAEAILNKVELTCPVCGSLFSVSAKKVELRNTCSIPCYTKFQTNWNITKEALEALIWNMSYVDIARVYPISDVGAKKRAKALGCKMPPPYFFNKTPTFREKQRKLNNIPIVD